MLSPPQARDGDCVSLLLAFGADVNAVDKRWDLTPLDIAHKAHNDYLVGLILGVGGKRFEAIHKVNILYTIPGESIVLCPIFLFQPCAPPQADPSDGAVPLAGRVGVFMSKLSLLNEA